MLCCFVHHIIGLSAADKIIEISILSGDPIILKVLDESGQSKCPCDRGYLCSVSRVLNPAGDDGRICF